MKKGDARREQILDVAQALFYRQGYEQTSINDILNEMSLSKGGFYHHFDSKLSLLEAICVRQIDAIQPELDAALNACANPVDMLNALLSACSLYRPDRLDFAGLFIPTAYGGRSWQLLGAMREATERLALPHMIRIVDVGLQTGDFFSRYPNEIGHIILKLYADMGDEIGFCLAGSSPQESYTTLTARLEACRASVETLLSAPFASVTLYDLTEVEAMRRSLVRTRKV